MFTRPVTHDCAAQLPCQHHNMTKQRIKDRQHKKAQDKEQVRGRRDCHGMHRLLRRRADMGVCVRACALAHTHR